MQVYYVTSSMNKQSSTESKIKVQAGILIIAKLLGSFLIRSLSSGQ